MSLSFVRAALVCLLLAMPLRAAPVELGQQVFHKDWAAACDNTLSCEALSLTTEGDGQPSIVLARDSIDGAVVIKLSVVEPKGDRYRILVDRQPIHSGAFSKGEWPILVEGADALRLARAIARGGKLAVQDGSGQSLGEMTLNGSAAALRHIDAVQNRAGTRSALVALGRRASRPKAAPLPVISAQRIGKQEILPDATAMVGLIESSGCAGSGTNTTEDTVYSLGRQRGVYRVLALVACGSGAYNSASVPFIGNSADGKKWNFTPAVFDKPDMPKVEGGVGHYLINYGWDAEKQQLSSYNKGRGLGDCGNAETYVWDGTMFRLVEAYAMSECRGSTEWMRLWRARVEFQD